MQPMAAVNDPEKRTSHRPPIQGQHFVASTGHYLATAAAHRIFARGGNAIDAGVAAGICINVLLPDFTSFGGVAPTIVYHRESDELRSFSGLGCWGEDANIEIFQREEDGKIPLGSRRSVVPGAPDAWISALAHYGRLTLEEVLAPAIELCEQGFPMYPSLHRNLTLSAEVFRQWPSNAEIFLPGGKVPEVGELLYQKDLGRTFRRLIDAERGASGRGRAAAIEAARDAFYKGDIGKEIASFVCSEGGFITEEDLANFAIDIEEPPSVTYRGVDVYACGPWCQGPVTLQALNVLEGFDLPSMGHNSAEYLSTIVQTLDLAFADREAYYGDPKFVDVPLKGLLSTEYARRQRSRVRPDQAFKDMPAPGDPSGTSNGFALTGPRADSHTPTEPDTSYLCVVDGESNAFSATPSDGMRSSPIIPGLGLVCSPRGTQSRLDPRSPASLQSGKRPRLTPNPAMAFKDGKLYMPFGTPGGDMQSQSMLQVFLNIVDFGMDPQEAIEQPRIGTFNFPDSFAPHSYRPGLRRIESRVPESVIKELEARGHNVETWPEWSRVTGNVCAIAVDPKYGTLSGGADARAEAYSIGW